MIRKTKTKQAAKKVRRVPKQRPTVGARIIEGLEQAIAWTRGDNDNVRATMVHVPEVNVREVRTKMGLSQAQFATKFGFPQATLRNWEQGRSHPDAPTRVLLAVIANIQRLWRMCRGRRADREDDLTVLQRTASPFRDSHLPPKALYRLLRKKTTNQSPAHFDSAAGKFFRDDSSRGLRTFSEPLTVQEAPLCTCGPFSPD